MLYLVHPCDDEDYGGCSQVCKKNGTEAVCECNAGFKVDPNNPKECTRGKNVITVYDSLGQTFYDDVTSARPRMSGSISLKHFS